MRRDDDRGVALIAVIGLGLVMSLLVATGLTVAVSGLRQADSVQDSSGALDAAYAGVQDYLARINGNPAYLTSGNPAAAFSAGSAGTLPATVTRAFLLGTDTAAWAAVPGSGGAATFRYEVDTTAYATSGLVRLRSTGRVGTTTRSLVADLHVRGFTDYTYFTDYEIQDPQISGADPDACTLHAWEGRPGASTCPTIQFGPNDSLSGRIHSNDTMLICGAKLGTATSANPNTPIFQTPSGCTRSNAAVVVNRAAELPMPATNTAMRAQASCVYTGPTRITYNDDGTMTVVSPWTRFTDVGSTPGQAPGCGTISALRSARGARVAQPAGASVFVQAVPQDGSDPNSWAAGTRPTGVTCLGADASATTNGDGPGWSFTTNGTTVQYPFAGEAPATNWRSGSLWATGTPAYGCRAGDLYVQGTVTTTTTAASANYVYITGDLVDADRSQDLLGLVGQNAVLVHNPLSTAGASMIGDGARRIDAAILSVAHTFQVQNYNAGPPRGALSVFGSISQKFRGPVATTNSSGTVVTGYTKSYGYDPLLDSLSPPRFLTPTSTSFLLQQYATVSPAFAASGAAQ